MELKRSTERKVMPVLWKVPQVMVCKRHKSAGNVAAAMEHRVGFRDRICFVHMVGLDTRSFLWIGSVLEIGSVLWIGSVVEIGSVLWIGSVVEIGSVL
jgi:hypothetical protein